MKQKDVPSVHLCVCINICPHITLIYLKINENIEKFYLFIRVGRHFCFQLHCACVAGHQPRFGCRSPLSYGDSDWSTQLSLLLGQILLVRFSRQFPRSTEKLWKEPKMAAKCISTVYSKSGFITVRLQCGLYQCGGHFFVSYIFI